MNYLLDTCVLSEFTRRQPSDKVIRWVNSVDEDRLFLSVVTIGEIQRGIERLPESARKTELLVWMTNGLVQRFEQRILPIDTAVMFLWGSLIANLEKQGKPAGIMDSLIIATALQHNHIVATRNTKDFVPSGVQTINPWI